MSKQTLSVSDVEKRVTFHDDIQTMEVSFADLNLDSSVDVNIFYDHVEERIAATGEDLWFFLVIYSNTNIDPDAWLAFAQRGKEVNKAHSMGSVRVDASEETRKQIERDAGTEAFDPNLFNDRESALARIKEMPTRRWAKIELVPSFTEADLKGRIEFLQDEQIMCVDLSEMSLEHSLDVDDVFDFIERAIEKAGQKWYFLINYENTRIQSPAWVQYAARGKKLNLEFSLGTVRYAPGSETEADIRLRAESQEFRPNIRNTREEALEVIAEMKQAADS